MAWPAGRHRRRRPPTRTRSAARPDWLGPAEPAPAAGYRFFTSLTSLTMDSFASPNSIIVFS